MSSRALAVYTGTMAILAVAISFWAHAVPLFYLDLSLALSFQSWQSDFFLWIAKSVSYAVGDWRGAVLVVIGAVIMWWRLGWVEAGLTVAAGALSKVDSLLKILVDRPRPSPDLVHVWVAEQGNGFPSGHALFAALFFGFLAYLVFTRSGSRSGGIASLAVLVILILLVGASRVYLGVHWPSDVVGGYLWGAALVGVVIWADRTLADR